MKKSVTQALQGLIMGLVLASALFGPMILGVV
jgi:hypothetical protein